MKDRSGRRAKGLGVVGSTDWPVKTTAVTPAASRGANDRARRCRGPSRRAATKTSPCTGNRSRRSSRSKRTAARTGWGVWASATLAITPVVEGEHSHSAVVGALESAPRSSASWPTSRRRRWPRTPRRSRAPRRRGRDLRGRRRPRSSAVNASERVAGADALAGVTNPTPRSGLPTSSARRRPGRRSPRRRRCRSRPGPPGCDGRLRCPRR